MDPLRDRIFGLLSDLCGQEHEVSPDSLRLLSHTIYGVSRDHAPSALFAVRDALPFVVALVEASDGADAETIADMLVNRGVVRALTRRTIARRIDAARAERPALGAMTTAPQSRLAAAMRDLAMLDARMVSLSMRSAQTVRDTLLDDPELFTCAVDLALDAESSEARARFAGALALMPDAAAPESLAILSDLECTWDGGALRANERFSERTRRFALAATDHLQQSGFLVAVRAALAFGPSSTATAPTTFTSFRQFDEDRSLDELAAALAAMRGKTLCHLRGEVVPQAFNSWIAYLRGPCGDLAGARDISCREATSFAHFCLHLMNFCDLATVDGADDSMRAAMMGVEDDLKMVAARSGRQPSTTRITTRTLEPRSNRPARNFCGTTIRPM